MSLLSFLALLSNRKDMSGTYISKSMNMRNDDSVFGRDQIFDYLLILLPVLSVLLFPATTAATVLSSLAITIRL